MKKHYLGAVYEVNKQNMNHLIEQLDAALSENKLLTQVTDERDQMANTCISMSQEIDELKRDYQDLAAQSRELYSENCKLFDETLIKANEIDELKRENEKLKEAHAMTKSHMRKVEFERDGLTEINEKLNEKLSERQDRVFKLNADFDSLTKQNEILKAALLEAKDHLNAIQSGLTTDINRVEFETKNRAHEAWLEVLNALAEVAKLEGAK